MSNAIEESFTECLANMVGQREAARVNVRLTLEHLARMASIEANTGSAPWGSAIQDINKALADLEIL